VDNIIHKINNESLIKMKHKLSKFIWVKHQFIPVFGLILISLDCIFYIYVLFLNHQTWIINRQMPMAIGNLQAFIRFGFISDCD
jgi:hypothetical protein